MTCHISLAPKPRELISDKQNQSKTQCNCERNSLLLTKSLEPGVFHLLVAVREGNTHFAVTLTHPHSTACNRGSVGGCEAWSPLQSQSLLIWGWCFYLWMCTTGSLAGEETRKREQMSWPSSPQVKVTPSSLHLDVSVGDVEAVEVVGGRADVPHDLRSLWEGRRKTMSQTGSTPRKQKAHKGTRLQPRCV